MQENGKLWHEDTEFWNTFADTMFSEARREETPKEVADIIAMLGIEPDSHILDLCCGVGRHSLEMARIGYKVTGVDRTKTYLDIARQKAADDNLDLELLEGDMRTFIRPDTFDAAINLFTSFGYFEDPEEDKQVVMNVYNSLKSGGVFLMDMGGKEVIARIYQERDWREEQNGTLLLQERKITKDWSWLDNRWIRISKSGERQEYMVSHRLYSAIELKSLLEDCGFRDVKVFGNFEGVPYDQNARRLVVRGRK
ncbi:MAG: class I SAM-dependent methyltransferase [Thermoplasmata archaeon]|nr:class I SAM-dependent methyltransferase [Thermoplasmata archaeon]